MKEMVAMGNLELVGTVEFKDGSVVKILRQFDPAKGFEYFLEEGGELKSFKVYHIEGDDWDAEIGGRKLRAWCEEALCYYESDEE
jgi:hypothetical protein